MPADLTLSFTVERTPEEVFDAINDVRHWWSGDLVGETTPEGAEWVYVTPDIHFSKFRTTVQTPGVRVEWLVLDSYLSFIADKYEWTGTTVRFDITPVGGSGGGSRLVFTHVGLTQDVECYGVCHTAWGQYVLGSLRDLILSGTGRPGFFSNRVSLDAALSGSVQLPE